MWQFRILRLTLNFVALQGTIDQFDYPKKGKNIPPSKHDAPAREEAEQEGDMEGEEGGQSYYDENGNRLEAQDQDAYGEEQYNGQNGEEGTQ